MGGAGAGSNNKGGLKANNFTNVVADNDDDDDWDNDDQ